MKMVKSLLLGSAAGLVAVTAGQAADLPVKAKPVEYVKICSLYGAGFYYIPGTDTCLKIGGYARAEGGWGYNGSVANNPYNANINDRNTSNIAWRARGYITADARDMTAYGVARGYLAVGVNTSDVGVATAESSNAGFSANRAFVQWAGFTAGVVVSFYDFYSVPLVSYRGFIPASDTGDAGWLVPLAYTAQFGGGFSATLAAEMRRTTEIVAQTGAGALGSGTIGAGAVTVGGAYGGWQVPDVVANLRVDQAWGAAQIMGALHEVNGQYYYTAAATDPQTNGHPGDRWGGAVGAGIRVNFPMAGPGDFFEAQVNWTVGASRYIDSGTAYNYQNAQGAGQSFGIQNDCVYGGTIAAGNATQCNLTTAWSFNAGYDHYYTNQWHQSLFGGWERFTYNTQANAILCSLIGGGNGAGAGTAAVATPGCNNNWDHWGVGSRLQWDVTKTFYIGVEAIYEHMDSATTFNGLITGLPVALVMPAAVNPVFVNNENAWSATLRFHKDFYP